jgi:fused signal recognition particle receptor
VREPGKMFDFLRNKVSEFAGKVKSAVSEKEPEPVPVEKPPVPLVLEKPKTKPVAVEVKKPPVKKEKPKVKLTTEIKKRVMGYTTLSENEIEGLLWDFEMALLEGDVATEAAERICGDIKEKLKQKRFFGEIRGEVEDVVKESIKEILAESEPLDLMKFVEKTEKPLVMMFLGPNGAGKTTTIAKLAYTLQKQRGFNTIFAASDTFRAASIEQLEEHANRLGIRVVKHKYGSDPAAVGFDAIKSAKAHGISCVMIDTAGRQQTNRNLMEELRKIDRVCKPHLKIFVGEAIAGNALSEQVAKFKESVGLDGLILTKMDVDVKGGGTISIAATSKVPILYFGTGQNYDDLEKFDPDEILKRIFG